MQGTIRGLQLFLTIAVFLLGASASPAQDPELLRHFDYDRTTPLNLRRVGVAHRERADVYDITYDSLKGGVVPAYLVVPKGRGPFPDRFWRRLQPGPTFHPQEARNSPLSQSRFSPGRWADYHAPGRRCLF